MLDNLEIILVKPRFPENIGMVARACANMGCKSITLVEPENFDLQAAAKTATQQGLPLLEHARLANSLFAALQNCNQSWAATARMGGWRKIIFTPKKAAPDMALEMLHGKRLALVFGNEKSGLTNRDIGLCSHIVHIPTFGKLSSLNIAQACLIMLYECASALFKLKNANSRIKIIQEQGISHANFMLLEEQLKNILSLLNCLQGKNPDYHFIQWHNMLSRLNLRRHEFDALMGFCHQLARKLKTINDNESTS